MGNRIEGVPMYNVVLDPAAEQPYSHKELEWGTF